MPTQEEYQRAKELAKEYIGRLKTIDEVQQELDKMKEEREERRSIRD